MEQVPRIELGPPGRKHGILPLNYTCKLYKVLYLTNLILSIYFYYLILCKTIDYFYFMSYNIDINFKEGVQYYERYCLGHF